MSIQLELSTGASHPVLNIALVLARSDHIASIIVNANHDIGLTEDDPVHVSRIREAERNYDTTGKEICLTLKKCRREY